MSIIQKIKNLFKKKKTTILIASPIFDGKDYCFDQWLDGILGLEVPDNVYVDCFLLENTTDLFNTEYFEKVLDKVKPYGDFFALSHVGLTKDMAVNRRLAHLYNYIRGYFLTMEYDYLFIVECDVVLSKYDLIKLWSIIRPKTFLERVRVFFKKRFVATGVTYYTPPPLTEKAKELLSKEKDLICIDDKFISGFGDTMMLKKLVLDETILKSYDEPLPIYIAGKSDWITIPTVPSKSYGQCPDYEAFKIDEVKKMSGVRKIAGCPVGCLLLDKKVFTKPAPLFFRFNSELALYNDWLFVMDLQRRGYEIWCDFDMKPLHLHRRWDAEVINEKAEVEI
jgi:hypothetical protein